MTKNVYKSLVSTCLGMIDNTLTAEGSRERGILQNPA